MSLDFINKLNLEKTKFESFIILNKNYSGIQ